MSSAIIARLGLDSGDFKRGLDQSAADLQGANRKMTQSTKERGAAAESVWEREKKVEAQLSGLAEKLTTASTAGDAMTATMNSLAESLNLPLAGAVGAAAGIAIGSALNTAAERAEKLRSNLAASVAEGKGLTEADGITAMHQGLSQIAASLAEINKERSGMEWLWNFAQEGLGDMFATSSADTASGKKEAGTKAALEEIAALYNKIAGAEGQVALIQEMILNGDEEGAQLAKVRLDYEMKRAAARKQGEKIGASEGDIAALDMMLRKQQEFAEQAVLQKGGKDLDSNMGAEAGKFLEAQGKDLDSNMAAEAKAALERNAAAKAGRDTENNMGGEASKFLEERKKKEEEIAEQGRATENQMHAEAMKHIEAQKAARLKAAQDSAAALRGSIADRTSDRDAKLQNRVDEILNPGSRADARRAKGRGERAFKRALREEDLAARGGKSARDVKGSDLMGPSMKDLGGDPSSIGAQLDATQMAKDMATVAKNLKAADV